MTDQQYLQRATKVGNRKAAPCNFGAVVVKDGYIIGHIHPKNEYIALEAYNEN